MAFRNRLWRSVNAARRTSVGAKTSLASDEVGFSATPRSAKEETARTAMPQRAMRASALPPGILCSTGGYSSPRSYGYHARLGDLSHQRLRLLQREPFALISASFPAILTVTTER